MISDPTTGTPVNYIFHKTLAFSPVGSVAVCRWHTSSKRQLSSPLETFPPPGRAHPWKGSWHALAWLRGSCRKVGKTQVLSGFSVSWNLSATALPRHLPFQGRQGISAIRQPAKFQFATQFPCVILRNAVTKDLVFNSWQKIKDKILRFAQNDKERSFPFLTTNYSRLTTNG